jgi:glutaredoxin
LKAKKSANHKHISPYGWYIASYLLRFIIISDKNKNKPNKKFSAWENTILVKSKNSVEAYKKAEKIAKSETIPYINVNGQKVKWIFEGFTFFLPVYEKIEDGSEILWRVHEDKKLKKIKSMVRKKNELEIFKSN